MAEYRKRDNYGAVFRHTLEDLAGQVNLGWVKTCVAFGTGSGEREIELARRLLPNLRSFQAVENDPESVRALRASFEDNQLPRVQTSVVETSLERWSGTDTPIDAVLFLSMLAHVHSNDRKALFQQLMTQYLSPQGIVIILDNVQAIPSGFLILKERLGMSTDDYEVMEKEMLDAGFRVAQAHDLRLRRDLAHPNDDIVRFVQLLTGYRFTDRHIRATIDDIFSERNMDVCMKKLAIFAK